MSQGKRHRRGDKKKYQDHGPTYESSTPNAGCNSTHVAKSRSKWKRRFNRLFRRTGKLKKNFSMGTPGSVSALAKAADWEDEG